MSRIRVEASDLRATIGGVEYEWCGGAGAVLKSYERGIKVNDLRMIGNVIFYAYRSQRCVIWREVEWIPQQEIDAEWIREFRAAVFGCTYGGGA